MTKLSLINLLFSFKLSTYLTLKMYMNYSVNLHQYTDNSLFKFWRFIAFLLKITVRPTYGPCHTGPVPERPNVAKNPLRRFST